MNEHLDHATTIRAGEELPIDRLQSYLRQQLPEFTGPLVIEQFAHGHSNLTYLLKIGATDLVLRRPPFGNLVKTAHDMSREFRVLSGLCAVYPPAPRPFHYCGDDAVLGAPFYIMERRRGVILRQDLPSDLTVDANTARRLGVAFIDNLALLHSLDYQTAGLGDLGKPEGYVARQVHGWIKRYADARTDDVPSLENVARWLGDNLPAGAGAALIHNDYKYDNLLLDPNDLTRIDAVLDWEMATVGDPHMDLGTTLGYWVEAGDPELMRHVVAGPTFLPGSLTRQELIARYEETTRRMLSNPLFYYCYGLFKIAGIVQQIYARFVRGHTTDDRFARLNRWVSALGQQMERALASGSV